MTTQTMKNHLLFILSSAVLLLLLTGHAAADVSGDIGVIGLTPQKTVQFQASPKPEDMDQIQYGPGVILLNQLAEEQKEDEEGQNPAEEEPIEDPNDEDPNEEQATKGPDEEQFLRIQFELMGPANAPFLLVALPSDLEVGGIEALRRTLAMTLGRFDDQGKADFGFTVPGTPDQLDGVKFVTLRACTPAECDDSDDEASAPTPAAPSTPGPQERTEERTPGQR